MTFKCVLDAFVVSDWKWMKLNKKENKSENYSLCIKGLPICKCKKIAKSKIVKSLKLQVFLEFTSWTIHAWKVNWSTLDFDWKSLWCIDNDNERIAISIMIY